MITNPVPLSSTEALALCLVAVVAVLGVLLARQRGLSFSTLIAVALIASAAAAAPFTVDSVVRDLRAGYSYSQSRAERIGPEDNGLDTTVVDRIARRIPRTATYSIDVAPDVGSKASYVFRDWAHALLLPRVAIAQRSQAQWIVTFGGSPSSLGLHLVGAVRVRSDRGRSFDAWVGRRA